MAGSAWRRNAAWRRSAVSLAVWPALWLGVAGILGACAPSEAAHHSDAVTAPSVTPTQQAVPSNAPKTHRKHRPYSDVNPPPRRAGDFVVKVLVVARTESGAWGEEVRTCVTRSSRHGEVVGSTDWRAEGVGGHLYPVRVDGLQPSWRPTYPEHKVLSPGQCVTGWWSVTVPKGPGIRAFQFAPRGGRTLIEWPTLR